MPSLAMKSGIIALGDKYGPKLGDNNLQILEFVSKKQIGACRSTFTAELYAALDTVSLASVINLALTEVLTGCRSASQMAEIQEPGSNALEADLFLVSAADTKSTTDRLMYIRALKLKEILAMRIASRMIWVDTRDMLCDALNKGRVSRDAIRLACSSGVWRISHAFKSHVEARTKSETWYVANLNFDAQESKKIFVTKQPELKCACQLHHLCFMPPVNMEARVDCCEGPWGRAECPEFACVSNETRAKWRCERKRLGSRGAGGSEWCLEPDPPYLVNLISPWFTRVHHSFGSWLMRFSCHLRLQVPGGGCASVDSLLGGDLRCSVTLNSDVHYVTLCIATFSFRCVLRAAAVSILRQRIEDASASRLHIGSAVSKICFILSFPPPCGAPLGSSLMQSSIVLCSSIQSHYIFLIFCVRLLNSLLHIIEIVIAIFTQARRCNEKAEEPAGITGWRHEKTVMTDLTLVLQWICERFSESMQQVAGSAANILKGNKDLKGQQRS